MTTHHRHHRKLLLFLVLFISSQQISGQISYEYCPSFTCGGVEVRYPFWNSSKKDIQYCGYERLNVACSEDNKTLTFATLTDNYTVKAIDYDKKTISLVDTDVKDEKCPKVQHDFNISNIPVLSTDPEVVVNLTFFFGCNLSIGDPPIPTGFPADQATCLDNGDVKAFVFAGEVNPKWKDWLYQRCSGGEVVSPVMKKGATETNVSELFPKYLKEGFQLKWENSDKADCRKCEGSGGRCGYSDKAGAGLEFVCFCKEGPPHRGDCNSDNGHKKVIAIDNRHKKKAIAIGVSVAAVFVVCVGAILWWCRKHKKDVKKESSGRSPLVRSISSDPSALSMDTQYQSNNHLAHIFTYKELDDATNGFHPSNELGDGGFGTVYKGEIRDGRTVAVKRLYGNNYKRMEQFMNEILILNKIRHPNLVTLYGCTSRQSRELLLVYEYVANGTVADHLHGSRAEEKSLTWPMRMRIAVETASALAYLHATEPQIVHRDVKTHNILLDKDFHVKVADFGLSRLFPTDVSHVSTAPQGTPGYVDPEYHQCYQLTDKSDVYSFGVVLVELISSKPAVDITRSRSEINLSNMATSRIRDGLLHELADPDLGFESDPDVTRMIRSVAELAFLCLQAEKDLRPCMEEVKNELTRTAGGGKELGEVYVDVEKNAEDDAYLLRHSGSCSPDTVMAQWKSKSTTPNTSA